MQCSKTMNFIVINSFMAQDVGLKIHEHYRSYQNNNIIMPNLKFAYYQVLM